MRPTVLACVAAVTACAHFSETNRSSEVSLSSAALERGKCGVETAQLEGLLVDPRLVEGVEPLYTYGSSGKSGLSARLRGAKLRLNPACGLTSAEVNRVLECRQLRTMAEGSTAAVTRDPYVLRDERLVIDVTTERDVLVVSLGVDDVAKAREVLDRARKFASIAGPGPSDCATRRAAR
jgi:hypothetical protein